MKHIGIFAGMTFLLLAFMVSPAAAVVSQSPIVDTNNSASSVDDNRLQRVAWIVLKDNASSTGTDEYSNEKIKIKTTGLTNVQVTAPPGTDSADASYGFDITSKWGSGVMYITLHDQRTQGRITVWGTGTEAYNSGTVTFYDDDDNSILATESFTVAHPAESIVNVAGQSGAALPTGGSGAGISAGMAIFGILFIMLAGVGLYAIFKKK